VTEVPGEYKTKSPLKEVAYLVKRDLNDGYPDFGDCWDFVCAVKMYEALLKERGKGITLGI